MAARDLPRESPRTNFDLLRLFAVVLVIYGNGLVLTDAPPLGLWGAPFPRIGLDLLFAISGYLAVGSWDRSPSLPAYIVGRTLRLFPAVVVCVVVTVAVIGPCATRLPLRAYLLDGLTRRYLANIVLVQQRWLPGVFGGQQWVGMVNPMLWTLVPGLLLWLGVPLLGRAPARLRSAAAASCAVAFAAAALVLAGAELQPPVLLLRINLLDMLTEAPFFLFGAALAWFEQQAGERLWRADLALLCFAANWVVASWLGGWDIVLEWVTLPYMAACFGRSSVPGLAWLRPLGNPSFGMFLFGFPLQQLIVEYWPADPHPILTCIGLAVPIGLLSWHLVERPALLRGLAAWRRGGLASLRIVF